MYLVTHVFGNKKTQKNPILHKCYNKQSTYNIFLKDNINIAIANGNECGVSCLKYKIILWRQFCIIVDSTSFE